MPLSFPKEDFKFHLPMRSHQRVLESKRSHTIALYSESMVRVNTSAVQDFRCQPPSLRAYAILSFKHLSIFSQLSPVLRSLNAASH